MILCGQKLGSFKIFLKIKGFLILRFLSYDKTLTLMYVVFMLACLYITPRDLGGGQG